MFSQKNYWKIEPASAAIIMALGIFLIGTIEAFPFLNVHLGKLLAFILLILWIVIYSLLTIQFFQRDFLIPFIKHPIHSFAMGTWIAGVSVLCNVFLVYFPSVIQLTQVIAIFNSLLWIFFFMTCLYNFKQLVTQSKHYQVHGIVLLSTVATQSIVVLLNNVFSVTHMFIETIIYLGLAFYLVGIYLIIKSINAEQNWSVTHHWPNTNCIIHGALSITGFSMVTTGIFSSLIINLLWIITFVLLIFVECLELIRAKGRIKVYGFSKGIFSYHVSQWSRNFTFGMFYVFTLLLVRDSSSITSTTISLFQTQIMHVWAWIVLFALIIEVIIFFKHVYFNGFLIRINH